MNRFADMQDDLPWKEERPLQAALLRGKLCAVNDIARFIEAGNATLTVQSRKTETRFTFKFSRPQEEPGKRRPIWVKVLNGQDNENDYAFIGTLWGTHLDHNEVFDDLRFSVKSKVGSDAPSVKALRWLLRNVYFAGKGASVTHFFELTEVWHEGRCGRCGRKLTVPDSISTGFGPECAGRMGL